MRGFVDLHVHSHFSDGTLSPTQLVEQAVQAGLDAIALTDHNTVAGLPEFLCAGESQNIRAIPGVEISAGYRGKEVHIVGLFLKPEMWDRVTDYLAVLNDRKTQSNRDLVRRLKEAGYEVDLEQLLQNAQGTVNRAVIAAKMLEKGYVSSVKEAFKGLLSEKNGYYVPPQRLDGRSPQDDGFDSVCAEFHGHERAAASGLCKRAVGHKGNYHAETREQNQGSYEGAECESASDRRRQSR